MGIDTQYFTGRFLTVQDQQGLNVITSKEKENPCESAGGTNWEHGQGVSSTLNAQIGVAQVTALA